MRLGIFDIHQVDPTDPDDAAAVYRRRLDHLALADDLGFDCAFTAERHFMTGYRCPAPGVWIGAASQRTKRMRLGVLAYTLPLHPPAALAEEIAVLDHLSGGRLEVGFGLGHRPPELEAIGVDPARRIPIFQERLAILRALWSGGTASFESETTILREVGIHPLPVQVPHPPLWYAGTDAGAVVWMASQGLNLAVGFAPVSRLRPATTAYIAARSEFAKRGQELAGGEIALMRHVYLAETDEQAQAEVVDDLLRIQEIRDLGGTATPESRADRRAAAEASAADLVRNEVMFIGSPKTVASGIRAAGKSLNLTTFLANPYATGVDDQRVERCLRLLATEVGPRLGETDA